MILHRSLILAIAAACASAPVSGQVLLWNNFLAPDGTGASHLTDPYRSTLDDIWFDAPVILTDFTMQFAWSDGRIGGGERVDLTLWTDEGNAPGEPRIFMALGAYEEVETGDFLFDLPIVDVHQQVIPLVIEPDTYWLEMHEIGPVNGFQLHTTIIGQEGWVNYEDFGGLQPESNISGDPIGFDFRLLGFVPGEPGGGFVRGIAPMIGSGEPGGDKFDTRESDDQYYSIDSGAGLFASRAQTAMIVYETDLPTLPLERLDVLVESRTTKPAVRQEIALFDFAADRWVILDDQPLPVTGDLVVRVDDLADPGRFIRGSDGKAKLRLQTYGPALTLQPHKQMVDEIKLVVTYE